MGFCWSFGFVRCHIAKDKNGTRGDLSDSLCALVETLGTCQQGCDSGCRSRGIRCSITWPSQGGNFARYQAHAQHLNVRILYMHLPINPYIRPLVLYYSIVYSCTCKQEEASYGAVYKISKYKCTGCAHAGCTHARLSWFLTAPIVCLGAKTIVMFWASERMTLSEVVRTEASQSIQLLTRTETTTRRAVFFGHWTGWQRWRLAFLLRPGKSSQSLSPGSFVMDVAKASRRICTQASRGRCQSSMNGYSLAAQLGTSML